MLVLDQPLLREEELVLVWNALFEYAQFPLLENQLISSIHKHYFWQDPLCNHVSRSRILFLRVGVPLSDSWLDLRLCDIQYSGLPVLSKK